MRRHALLVSVSAAIAVSVLFFPLIAGESYVGAKERQSADRASLLMQLAQANTAAAASTATGDRSAKSYHAARWDPIHFKPAIDKASDADCLTITYDSAGVKSGTTADCW